MRNNSVKRLLARLLALGLVGSTAWGGTLDEVREKGVLRVAVYRDFPPYSYTTGGVMKGVDIDIVRTLAERLGVGISTMALTPSDEAMEDDLRNAVWKGHYLGGGTADVMMHVPVDRAFAAANDQVNIFGPYFQEQIAIAHHRERIPQLTNLLVFARQRIGVELETFPDTYLSTAEGGRLRHNVARYRTITAACAALKDDAVAAIMAPQAQLEDCLGDGQDKFGIAAVPLTRVSLFTWTIGMAIKADDVELGDALSKALAEIRADGTLEGIFAQYGISYVEPAGG